MSMNADNKIMPAQAPDFLQAFLKLATACPGPSCLEAQQEFSKLVQDHMNDTGTDRVQSFYAHALAVAKVFNVNATGLPQPGCGSEQACEKIVDRLKDGAPSGVAHAVRKVGLQGIISAPGWGSGGR